MACLLVLVVVLFPRVVLVLMYLTSNYLQRAYHHQILLPLVGFFILPLTTLVYAWEVNSAMPIAGVNLIILVVAVIIDVGGWGGAYGRRRW